MLGMSAGEERSASGGGGWTNLDRVFARAVVVVVVDRIFFQCQAFRDLIDGKDIAHRAGCFRVAMSTNN